MSASYSDAKQQKSSWLDEAAKEVKSSRGIDNSLQIDRSLEFEPSVFKEGIRKKLPNLVKIREKANKTTTKKIYDELESLTKEKELLESKCSIATKSEDIMFVSNRLKEINLKIKKIIEDRKNNATSSYKLDF